MMLKNFFICACLVIITHAQIPTENHALDTTKFNVSINANDSQSDSDSNDNDNASLIHDHNDHKRTGRIMKILNDPMQSQRMRIPQKPMARRERYTPPTGGAIPIPPYYQRNPIVQQSSPSFGGTRGSLPVVRRVHSGPPHNFVLRPKLNHEQGKLSRHPVGGKEAFNYGKGAIYRPHYTPTATAGGPHPNALSPPQTGNNLQQQFHNFKPSPQYSGAAIVRPVSEFKQYVSKSQRNDEFKQYPLPQQHPQHQQYHPQQQQQQQQQQQPFPSYTHRRPNINTAPQTFPLNSLTEPLMQSAASSHSGDSIQKMYSVYEDSEFNERAPNTIQYNSPPQSPQNTLNYHPSSSSSSSSAAAAAALPYKPTEIKSSPSHHHMTAQEAEEYLQFMSTNEYFLPKMSPNYKKIDEDKDMRQYKQLQQQQAHFGRKIPINDDASGSATYKRPIEVSKLFYQQDASPSSTIVRGSYQAGNNVFVVKSDGNKAIKHVVDATTPSSSSSASSSNSESYNSLQYNPSRQRTPEPIRFEFTERDAIVVTHTSAPPISNVHLRYQVVHGSSAASQADLSFHHDHHHHHQPISVNEVDADPEDGDDMHDTGTGTFGRIPIQHPSENSISGNANSNSNPTTPATEQKDTEEFCERMCANVQDEDDEIVCGSDGYMYTSEAQMECYASCLHIDVTIQGKGSCSAR